MQNGYRLEIGKRQIQAQTDHKLKELETKTINITQEESLYMNQCEKYITFHSCVLKMQTF